MAYVAVEADEVTFLGDNASNTRPGSAGVSNVDRGYLSDQPHPRKSGGGFWTVEYYQVYFEVDTKEVLRRCYSTLLPTSTNYFSTHLNPPDLYGPFWTLTTLIFTLFLSSSLAASISAYLSSADGEYDYDFGLLSQAVGIVYAYGLGLPVLLWISLRYMGVGEWSVVDAVAIWGYALFVWIPVSAEAKATRLLIIVIGVLHAALALVFKVLFFGYYVVDKIGMDLPLPGGNDPNSAGGAVKMLVRRLFFGL
ncbi:hypothetical protein HHX47_DHR2000426 [Lentinula edodes]|nr:hypothetical protein HHX47_DHR2000426 [Lentinula edodes]